MALLNNFNWPTIYERIHKAQTIKKYGWVNQVTGIVIEGRGPLAAIGDLCSIKMRNGEKRIGAEVVGFKEDRTLMMPLGEISGIEPGCQIIANGSIPQVQVGFDLLGRVLDGLGQPLDGKGPIHGDREYPLYGLNINPVVRQRICTPLDVGVKAVNALLTLGKGQRIGIFAGSGVGKSTLLGMMARHTKADVNVIALIGERSREVREFIEKCLEEEGLKKSILVVATADQNPIIRMRGAYLATAIAEYFRDQNKDVLFMMDSITRFAMAAREVGLAIGEPPTSRGYTPSVFTQLPKLLERAGTSANTGSITGIYTVLVEGDDLNDPIADAIRSIADGHIVLSRELATQNHYPAIDILESISRVMVDIVSPEQMVWRNKLVSLMAAYKGAEDLINLGAYKEGSNAVIDFALKKMPQIGQFLQQGIYDKFSYQESLDLLRLIFE
ncbi:MAG: FliI/YscN family ATPase [Thermodesulfobacteriota bacterium]